MSPRQLPLTPPSQLLAGHGPHSATTNTLESMLLALRLGATGLATAAWLTRDGAVALHRTPTVGAFRKKRLRDMDVSDLPVDVTTLAAVHERVGIDVPLLVVVGDSETATAVLAQSLAARADHRLILASADWRDLADLRGNLSSSAFFVHVTAPTLLDGSSERHAALLRDSGIDGVSMAHDHWTGGAVALHHRFKRLCIATGADHERMIERLLHIGIDAVVGDHADRLHDASAPYR